MVWRQRYTAQSLLRDRTWCALPSKNCGWLPVPNLGWSKPSYALFCPMCDSLNGFTWDLQRRFQVFFMVRVFQVLIPCMQPCNSIYFRSINSSPPQLCGTSNSETISFPEELSQMLVKDRRFYWYEEESLGLNVALELGPEGLAYSLPMKLTVLNLHSLKQYEQLQEGVLLKGGEYKLGSRKVSEINRSQIRHPDKSSFPWS